MRSDLPYLRFGTVCRKGMRSIFFTMNENVLTVLSKISKGNNLGEKIELLGATKTVSVDKINDGICSGLKFIGENYAQEFRDKFPFYLPVKKYFIGTLQKNKLKYLVGKADVISSVNSFEIATEIDDFAKNKSVVQDIMLELNAGDEEQKTGIKTDEFLSVYDRVSTLKNVKIIGVMVMLPLSLDEDKTANLCKLAREIFDELKSNDGNIKYLSMGTSKDYEIAINNGSNMIRLGESLFGKRIKKEG